MIYGLEGVTTFTLDGEETSRSRRETLSASRAAPSTASWRRQGHRLRGHRHAGVFGPAYFHELAAVLEAVGDGPPDPEAFKAVMLRHGLTPARQPVA
jgi:hypothetical protein